MNSWKLNSTIGHIARSAICKHLGIHNVQIYRKVKNIHSDGTIKTDNGKLYKLVLKEINNEQKESM